MLQVEYRHDIQKNYLVVQGREEEHYMLHMLAGKYIQGFLPLEIREWNNEKEYYYDITGKESISQISNQGKWKGYKIKRCISQILTEIGKCREYLLNPDNLVLDADYIYIDTQSKEVSLCYVQDYNIKINEQLTGLFSYFMNVVDYQDKEAVQVVYQLYEKSRAPHCTLQDLQKLVSLETKKPIIKKIEPDVHENENENGTGKLQKNRKSLLTSGNMMGANHKNSIKNKGILSEKKSYKEPKKTENTEKEKNELQKRKNEKTGIGKTGRAKKESLKETKKRNIKENIILTGILQIALLFLLAVAAKAGIFQGEQGISPIKSMVGLLILGALDVFIMGRVFKADEEETRLLEENMTEKSIKEENITVGEEDVEQIRLPKLAKSQLSSPIAEIEKKLSIMDKQKGNIIGRDKSEQEVPLSIMDKQKETIMPIERSIQKDRTVVLDYDKTIIQMPEPKPEKKQCYLVPEEQGQEIISLGEFPFFIGRFQKDTESLEKKKNISRMHSKIEQMGEQYYITDLNSTNGTFVNEKRIEQNQRIELTEGDKVSFADNPYYFTKEWKAS